MNVVAIIPARGGSKRIKKKNIINFAGKPMIAWTIQAAIASKVFSRIVVSTDDDEIRQTAIENGAEVPFFRTRAFCDQATVSSATISAIKQAEEHWNEKYDVVVQLMPNCPMRRSSSICDALDNFKKKKLSFQISCFKFGWMNPWWAAKVDGNNKPEVVFKEALTMRSQDLPDLYCPTGAIWIAKVQELVKSESFYGNDFRFFPIDWREAVDIDDYEDLAFAKAVAVLNNI